MLQHTSLLHCLSFFFLGMACFLLNKFEKKDSSTNILQRSQTVRLRAWTYSATPATPHKVQKQTSRSREIVPLCRRHRKACWAISCQSITEQGQGWMGGWMDGQAVANLKSTEFDGRERGVALIFFCFCKGRKKVFSVDFITRRTYRFPHCLLNGLEVALRMMFGHTGYKVFVHSFIWRV